MGLEPSQSIAACLIRSKNAPLVPLISDISITMARELGPDGIRANAITPGLILTDFSRSGATDESKHAIANDWPLARAGDPAEIAGACLFLASDLSSYVTGVTLDVNGGAYMR
jgi:NAD(P)-dependent dehydrogenase (short-subunit alcohol dehydrogenase family)